MNVLIHCYMDRSSALLEGEVCYIEVSVVRKGVTQQAAQGCSRQQQPIGGLDILYLNTPPQTDGGCVMRVAKARGTAAI